VESAAWAGSEQRRRAIGVHLALIETTLMDEFEMMHPRGRLGRWVDKAVSAGHAKRIIPRERGRVHASRERRRAELMQRGAPVGGIMQLLDVPLISAHGRKFRLRGIRSDRPIGTGGLSKAQVEHRKRALGVPEPTGEGFWGLVVDDHDTHWIWTQTKGREGVLTPAINEYPYTEAYGGGGPEFGLLKGTKPIPATLPEAPSALESRYWAKFRAKTTTGVTLPGERDWLYPSRTPVKVSPPPRVRTVRWKHAGVDPTVLARTL
jgi:hypothetical protein